MFIKEKTKNITFIDLGEVVISHPFFSLIGCLQQTKRHHGLTEDDERYQLIKNACLNNFTIHESEKCLLEAFNIAQILHFPYEALCNYRLMIACGMDECMLFQHGKLSRLLRDFIAIGKQCEY